MRRFLLSSVLCCFGLLSPAIAQELLVIGEACSYYGEPIEDQVYGFTSDQEAEQAVARIMRFTGLPQNFTIMAANVPNAAAVIREGKRLILYNQAFMERVKRTTNTDWAAISILAHEIGHHLSGHTLEAGGSRPETELQADKFSGFTLFKMEASLEDAQAAMESMVSEGGSATHPPRSARLAAIANGWMEARDQTKRTTPNESLPENDTPPERQPIVDEPEEDIPPPDPAPGLTIVARCTFHDGSASFLTSTGEIYTNYMGTTISIGRRVPSQQPGIAWFYVVQSSDPTVQYYLNIMGLSGTTYAVDDDGVIWGQNAWGQPVQMGYVTYQR